MENRYTGVFEHVGEWWVGHVEELPGCNAFRSGLLTRLEQA
jgi:predicted RNase H-like HicB family nuclease